MHTNLNDSLNQPQAEHIVYKIVALILALDHILFQKSIYIGKHPKQDRFFTCREERRWLRLDEREIKNSKRGNILFVNFKMVALSHVTIL